MVAALLLIEATMSIPVLDSMTSMDSPFTAFASGTRIRNRKLVEAEGHACVRNLELIEEELIKRDITYGIHARMMQLATFHILYATLLFIINR
jgi:hypothetical protein